MPGVWKSTTKAWNRAVVLVREAEQRNFMITTSFSCTCPSGTLKTGKFITGTGFSTHFYSCVGWQESKYVNSQSLLPMLVTQVLSELEQEKICKDRLY